MSTERLISLHPQKTTPPFTRHPHRRVSCLLHIHLPHSPYFHHRGGPAARQLCSPPYLVLSSSRPPSFTDIESPSPKVARRRLPLPIYPFGCSVQLEIFFIFLWRDCQLQVRSNHARTTSIAITTHRCYIICCFISLPSPLVLVGCFLHPMSWSPPATHVQLSAVPLALVLRRQVYALTARLARALETQVGVGHVLHGAYQPYS